MRKTTFAMHPVTLAWFSIQILENSKIFTLLLNLSLTHLRAQIACYEQKGDLSSVMLRECFMTGLKISKLQVFVWKSMQG